MAALNGIPLVRSYHCSQALPTYQKLTCKYKESRRITRFANLLPKFKLTNWLDQCSKPEHIRVRIPIIVIILSREQTTRKGRHKIRLNIEHSEDLRGWTYKDECWFWTWAGKERRGGGLKWYIKSLANGNGHPPVNLYGDVHSRPIWW